MQGPGRHATPVSAVALQTGDNRNGQGKSKPISSHLTALLVFALELILNLSVIFPQVYELNPLDGPEHIVKGQSLISSLAVGKFTLIPFSANPLIALLYAIAYIPVHESLYWLIASEWIVRFVLFCLLWLGAYLIALRLRGLAHPLIFIGLLIAVPLIPQLISDNETDALFAAMSGFAFWQVLGYYQTSRTHHVWLASLFLALAAHSRNDGLVLFFTCLVLIILILWIRGEPTRHSLKTLLPTIGAFVIPFGVIVGGYIIAEGVVDHTFDIGLSQRAYLNFEIAQATVYSSRLESVEDGIAEARRLYGTPEENNYSIVNAIRRNPTAFTGRVGHLAQSLGPTILRTYSAPVVQDGSLSFGDLFGPLSLSLAVIGALALCRRRRYLLVAVFVLWPSFLLVYFAFYFPDRYLLLPYFVVVGLDAIGLSWLAPNVLRRQFIYYWGVTVTLVLIVAIVAHNVHALVGVGVLTVVVLIAYSIGIGFPQAPSTSAAMLLVVLCGILVLKGPTASPSIPGLGSSSEDRVAQYLKGHLTRGTSVASLGPAPVYMAKMHWVPLVGDVHSLTTDAEFRTWIRENKVKAIYVDYLLKWLQPKQYDLIEADVGHGFTEVMVFDDQSPERERFMRTIETSLGIPLSRRHQIMIVDDGNSELGHVTGDRADALDPFDPGENPAQRP